MADVKISTVEAPDDTYFRHRVVGLERLTAALLSVCAATVGQQATDELFQRYLKQESR